MNAVMVCAPSGSRKNIGDYIQSVSQEQFLGDKTCYVERENLCNYSFDEKVSIIMNGWFMWHPENFPPASCFNPLFISFHLVPNIVDRFFSEETINYLKQYEPIGTRDLGTLAILESKGIKGYFSGCLTTTLNYSYLNDKDPKDKVIFVDPYYSIAGTRNTLFNIGEYFRDIYLSIKHFKKVSRFVRRFENEYWTWYGHLSRRLERRISASVFYEHYSKLMDDDTLINADFITHNIPSSKYTSDDEWMNAAKDLIRCYARARFVITSRIHCALPCLGVQTPVIFVTSSVLNTGQLRSPGRFGGLLEMLNVIQFGNQFKPVSPEMISLLEKGKISYDSSFSNPPDYKEYRDNLIHRVVSFLQTDGMES